MPLAGASIVAACALARAYFGEIEAFINGNPDFPNQNAGRNSSNKNNFVEGAGFDNFARVRFHYLLPIGHGREEMLPHDEVVDGLAVGGFTGAQSLNPIESGRELRRPAAVLPLAGDRRRRRLDHDQYQMECRPRHQGLGERLRRARRYRALRGRRPGPDDDHPTVSVLLTLAPGRRCGR